MKTQEIWLVSDNEIEVYTGKNISEIKLELPIQVETKYLEDFLNYLSCLIDQYSYRME